MSSSPKTAAGPRRKHVRLWVGSLLVLGTAILAWNRGAIFRTSSSERPASIEPTMEEQAAQRDRQLRRLLLGTWHDRFEGKRTMTLCEDGTGTMVVDLEGWKASLFARHLRFDMLWSLDNGHLKKRTTGGEPAVTVQAILKTMGDRVDEPILELTEERLLLLDRDGKTQYDWRRVE